jgi:glutathione S-transferase
VRELILYLEVHVELVARRLYGQVFFGKPPSESARQSVERELAKGLRGLKRLVKFNPFIAGPELTLADCAAFCHLPLVSLATKAAYGRDFLEDLPQVKPYIAMLKQRSAFARVDEDRKAAQKK